MNESETKLRTYSVCAAKRQPHTQTASNHHWQYRNTKEEKNQNEAPKCMRMYILVISLFAMQT